MSSRTSRVPSTLSALRAAGLATGALLLSAAVVAACAGDGDAAAGDPSVVDGGRLDGEGRADAADARADAARPGSDVAACAALRAYREQCGQDLECGPDAFDAWCLENTRSADSEAYRAALLACATADNCTPDDRKHCMYQHYAQATQSAAQQELTRAFCETCQPAAVGSCMTKTTTYPPALGPSRVTSEFLAVWELSDEVADRIRAGCTGAKLGVEPDAGADACATAFDQCAGNFFVDALADCPK